MEDGGRVEREVYPGEDQCDVWKEAAVMRWTLRANMNEVGVRRGGVEDVEMSLNTILFAGYYSGIES